jgi:hypothetical protein
MTTPLAIRIVFWTWLIVAVAAGRLQWMQALPPIAMPAVILGLTALLALAYRKLGSFRAWVDAIDLRGLVLLHVTRFAGFYFLLLYDRGELPYAFAVPGGLGDIAVAFLALGVCLFPLNENRRRHALSVWNFVGLIDLLLVISTAARLGFTEPGSMRALTQLPLSLLPSFLVPLLLATHLVIYARLSRTSGRPSG